MAEIKCLNYHTPTPLEYIKSGQADNYFDSIVSKFFGINILEFNAITVLLIVVISALVAWGIIAFILKRYKNITRSVLFSLLVTIEAISISVYYHGSTQLEIALIKINTDINNQYKEQIKKALQKESCLKEALKKGWITKEEYYSYKATNRFKKVFTKIFGE